jgi:hypothetical protein
MNIEEILSKHIGDDGKFDQEAAAKELKEVQGKEYVPKTEFNSKNEDLKKANETIDTLQKENKDVETLQTTINEYKTQIEELETERAEERKTYAIKEALQGAGAQDVDYMIYKLGDVEVNKDGSIKDLSNKIKSLKEENPTFFATEENKDDPKEPMPPNGFTVIDNKLDNENKPSKSYSHEELSKLTPEEINQNWDAVSASLEKGN